MKDAGFLKTKLQSINERSQINFVLKYLDYKV